MNPVKEIMLENNPAVKQNKKQKTNSLSFFDTLLYVNIKNEQVDKNKVKQKVLNDLKTNQVKEEKNIKSEVNIENTVNTNYYLSYSQIKNENINLTKNAKKYVNIEPKKDKDVIKNSLEKSQQVERQSTFEVKNDEVKKYENIKNPEVDKTKKLENHTLQSILEKDNNLKSSSEINKLQPINQEHLSKPKRDSDSYGVDVLRNTFNPITIKNNQTFKEITKENSVNETIIKNNQITKEQVKDSLIKIQSKQVEEKQSKTKNDLVNSLNSSQPSNTLSTQEIITYELDKNLQEPLKESMNVNVNSIDKTPKSNYTDTTNQTNQSNLVVSYDSINSGYNSSKFSSDTQQWQNSQQFQQTNYNPNPTSNFQVVYQNTNINATISQNVINILIKSSDVKFTPQLIDGIKNILETAGYKDVRLTLKDKEKVYKINTADSQQTVNKKGINLAV